MEVEVEVFLFVGKLEVEVVHCIFFAQTSSYVACFVHCFSFMEALLALAPPALLSAAPLPAPAAAAGVAAPVAVAPHAAAAPKRRHRQTHGAGLGASMEKMATLRCIKRAKATKRCFASTPVKYFERY